MSYIGYINVSQTIEQTPQIIRLMKSHGCGNIHIGQSRDKERIEWCRFIDSLSNGDSAVFASFDNVFNNFHDMMFFIKYCSKMDIRIISLSDGLDTHDILFPETRTSDTLNLICKVFGKRDNTSHDDLEAELYSYNFEDRKLKRYKLVINMYKAGYSVREIMERTGYRGKAISTEYCINITSRWNTPPCQEPPIRFAINPSDEIFSLSSWKARQRFLCVFPNNKGGE